MRLCQSWHIQWSAIPPGFFDAKYHVIAPPSKILWGRLPPPPLPPPMALVYTNAHARSHTYPLSAHAQKLQIRAEHPPFTNTGYATDPSAIKLGHINHQQCRHIHTLYVNPFTTRLPIHRRRNPVRIVGAPVGMRTHKVGGEMRPRTLTLRAQSGCASSQIQWSAIPYPVSSPQNTMSTCIIILQTGGGVLTFRRIVAVSYPNFVGALLPPPPLPPPPGSAAYAILMVPWLISHTCILACNPTSRLLFHHAMPHVMCIYVAQDTPI